MATLTCAFHTVNLLNPYVVVVIVRVLLPNLDITASAFTTTINIEESLLNDMNLQFLLPDTALAESVGPDEDDPR